MKIEIMAKMADSINRTGLTARSKWAHGVSLYAADLLTQVLDRATDEGHEPRDLSELSAWMLNGARDWREYSEGGCSLIYDGDIADRLATPSERKRSSRVDWLGVQARALWQAEQLLRTAYAEAAADLAAQKEAA